MPSKSQGTNRGQVNTPFSALLGTRASANASPPTHSHSIQDVSRRVIFGSMEEDQENHTLLRDGQREAKRFFTGFLDFAFSGNIIEIAIGLILAQAFTQVTTSLVSDILLPPISIIFPLNRNLAEKFAVLKKGPRFGDLDGYTTAKQAQEDGAIILSYGTFINTLINFMGVGIALYLLANLAQLVSQDPIIKRTVKCRYCKKYIGQKAIRCVNCTSWLDGREERMR